MVIVVIKAIRGFAKGRNDAPKRFSQTTSIGEPQQPMRKHPAKARNPERVAPPIAAFRYVVRRLLVQA